jgi:RNA polymerase nonessential primary-like sigma factor
MNQATHPMPATDAAPSSEANAKVSSPLIAARYFLSLALRYDYLSSSLRHKQTRRVVADRKENSRNLQLKPSATGKVRDVEGLDNNDSERAYLNHIAQVERLTSSEEYCLAKRVEANDTNARNALIEANLGLVVMLARHYRRPDMPLIDLIAEGNIGLIAATHSFNPELGFRFSTYAKLAVRHAIERKLLKLMCVQRALTSQTLKSTSVDDIDISDLEGSDSSVQVDGMAASMSQQGQQPLTIASFNSDDAGMTAQGFSAEQESLATLTIPEHEEPPHVTHAVQRSATLARALAQLSERERIVITQRYALSGNDITTLDQLAQQFRVSIERVRQIECAALKKMNLLLRSAGESPDSLL